MTVVHICPRNLVNVDVGARRREFMYIPSTIYQRTLVGYFMEKSHPWKPRTEKSPDVPVDHEQCQSKAVEQDYWYKYKYRNIIV